MNRFVVITSATIASFLSLLPAEAHGQNPPIPNPQVLELRKQIKMEQAAHAGAERLATFWLKLAGAYQAEFDDRSAEDSFVHAIRLLRETGAKELYATALEGISSLYMATGRPDAAERCLKKALELEQGSRGEASTWRYLALTFAIEGRYSEALMHASNSKVSRRRLIEM